ncbi:MAG TPA: YMGG-like glycine zipper-containing protein [Steroidobacteraceae bacterium]|nr:YMGG-like glycine zipper-containing protein [Steroidobacteraceae bacterium]
MPSNAVSILCMVSSLVLVTTAGAQAPPSAQGKSLAASAGVFAYPAKGQKPDKQAQDEAECYNWSKQQSGYDPMSPPPPPAPAQAAEVPKSTADGSRARGALRGAAAGAIIGEVAGNDAGKGAAIGATAGVLAGGRQNRMAQSQKQQEGEQQAQADAAQAAAAQQELANAFKKGMAVCLEARGYTVK